MNAPTLWIPSAACAVLASLCACNPINSNERSRIPLPAPELTHPRFEIDTRDFSSAPFTHRAFANDPEQFQFAIVSDRTGGHRAGVFPSAVQKLNLLQPEFVLSVGDLIEGYSTDAEVVETQWREFNSIVNQLEAPFFYTPGNHDYSNAVMADSWREKYGAAYYHFVYKNVLFLVLNTEEAPEAETPDLSNAQLSYFSEMLGANPNVRWTFVLMHQPLWQFAGAPNWNKLEAALADRDYTAFAGHEHAYQYQRATSGAERIVLGTTGGVTPGRGKVYGEFDHVTWVTVRENGPVIANLSLPGIADRFITPPDFAAVFKRHPVFRPSPWFVSATPASGSVHEIAIAIENPFDEELDYRIELPASTCYQLLAEAPSGILPPGASRAASIHLRLEAEMREPLAITVSARVTQDELNATEWEWQFLMQPVFRYTAGRAVHPIVLDGQTDEWPPLRFQTPHGGTKGDGFRFDTAYDDDMLYIALDVTDGETVQATSDDIGLSNDFVQILLDGRPIHISAGYLGFGHGVEPDDVATVFVAPDGGNGRTPARSLMPEGTRVGLSEHAGGYSAEVAISAEYLNGKYGESWREFRLNVTVNDADPSKEHASTLISWQPAWIENFYGTGIFEKR